MFKKLTAHNNYPMKRKTKHPHPSERSGRNRPPLLDTLEERVASGTREERREALKDAVERGDERAGDLVAQMFVDERLDDLDRAFPPPSVMEAIAKLGISRKMQERLLENLLQDSGKWYYSGLVLGEAADASAIPALADVIERRRMARGLPFLDALIWDTMTGAVVDCVAAMHRRKVDCSGTVEPLIKLLEMAADPDLKTGVIEALAELGDRRAGEPIWRAMAHLHPIDRKLAQAALIRLNFEVPKKEE